MPAVAQLGMTPAGTADTGRGGLRIWWGTSRAGRVASASGVTAPSGSAHNGRQTHHPSSAPHPHPTPTSVAKLGRSWATARPSTHPHATGPKSSAGPSVRHPQRYNGVTDAGPSDVRRTAGSAPVQHDTLCRSEYRAGLLHGTAPDRR